MAPATHLLYALLAFLAFDTAFSAPTTTTSKTSKTSTSASSKTSTLTSTSASSETSTTTPSPTLDTSSPNGPYSNPYDYTPAPVTWPGLPTDILATPSAPPGPAFPSGGLAQFASKYLAPAWILKSSGDSLTEALDQAITNGESLLGSLNAPLLPVGGIGNVYSTVVTRPTHTVTAGETPTSGPCATAPNTGVTRTYTFDVSYQTIAPDGNLYYNRLITFFLTTVQQESQRTAWSLTEHSLDPKLRQIGVIG
jgi:hypothetical protein